MIAFLKQAVMVLCMFQFHGRQIGQAMRAKQPRPLAYQPDWVVGIIVLTFRTSRSPRSRHLYAEAVREWRLRRP